MSGMAVPGDDRAVSSGKYWKMIVLAEITGRRMIEPPC
jgi:hypothetical protein